MAERMAAAQTRRSPANPITGWRSAWLSASGWAFAAIAICLVVPYVAMRVGLAAQDRFRAFDSDQAFIYLYAHHAVEAVAGLLLVLVLARPAIGWISHRGDVRLAIRAIAVFTLTIAVLAVIVNDVPVMFGAQPPKSGYALVPRNVLGVLLFQLVAVGVGEELLFRGAVLGVLRRAFSRPVRLMFFQVSLAGIITAALFGLAHAIFYDLAFWPIAFSPNWLQVGYAFALGVYYAAVTERTGSLWAAIVSHNISDVLYVLALWWAVGAGSG